MLKRPAKVDNYDSPARVGRQVHRRDLVIYREAVQPVEAHEAKSQPIYAAGKATKAAKELFQDNLQSWQPE